MPTPWSEFSAEKYKKIFEEKKTILDIGGGLRLVKEKNNRISGANDWLMPYLANVEYKILDPVPDYNPDIIGDIHNLPLADNSYDAIICSAVLEHVENPIQAFKEMYRVLKSGGYLYVYVPFLYYYHAEKGYYGDYWRFTEDSLRLMGKPFSQVELMPVGGAIETWIRISPLSRMRSLFPLWQFLDRVTGKIHTKQVSGYKMFLIK